MDYSNGDPVPAGGLSYAGGSGNQVTLNAAADTAARTVTLDSTTPSGDTPFGTVSGLSAGIISYEYADTAGVTLDLGSGANTVNVLSTGTALTLVGGAGNDAFNIGNGSLASLAGAVTVNGGGSTNTATVNDTGDAAATTYTVTSTTVAATGGFGGLTYFGLASLAVDGGSAGDTYNVNSTAAGTPVTATGGAGNDTFDVGSGTLASLAGGVTVNGGGSDGAVVNDIVNAAATTYTVTSTTVAATGGFGGLTYFGLASLAVDGGSAANTYNVNGTASGTATALNGRAGNDVFDVGNGSLAALAGAVTVAGGGGTDAATVNDSGDAAATSYTVTSSTVAATGGFAGLTYFGLASLAVVGGSAGDTYNLNGTYGGTPVTATGGAGNDTFNVSTVVLAAQVGAVTVNGGGGSDSAVLTDTGNAAATTYTVTSTTVAATGGFAGLTYGGLASLTLNGGSAADTYNVASTAAGTAVTLNGGAASDTFNLASASANLSDLQGAVTVNGNGGTADTLNAKDGSSGAAETYHLTATTLTRSGSGGLTYGTVEKVNVTAGAGNDAFFVDAAPTATTTVNLGGGSNTLTGPNAANTWTIKTADGGTLGTKLTFSNAQDLVGGTATDTFKFTAAGSVSGTVNGGGGTTNKLDYSGDGGVAVTVNLQTHAAPDVFGGAAGGFSNIESLAGSTAGTDQLIGANATTAWTISGLNAGKAGTFAFTGVENLVGGTGLDTFKFSASTSQVSSIDGGGAPLHQGDWLDYSSYPADVTVNLTTGAATGVAGSVANIQNVHGSNHNNSLTGSAQGNILIGGNGSSGTAVNTITGGSGRSLLIADKGLSHITGGSGGDIMIGGYTSYDTMTTANEVALMSILAEWQSGDSYSTRATDINTGGGGGLNGTNKLNWGTKVFDNGQANTLTAAPSAAAADWYFASTTGECFNTEHGEYFDNLTTPF